MVSFTPLNRLLLLSFFLILGCTSQTDLSKIPTDGITRLHMPGASHYYDARPSDTRQHDADIYSSVGYEVKLKYPATAAVDFYEDQLKALKYLHYKNKKWSQKTFEWQTFADSTRKENPCVYLYLADWVDRKKTRIVGLSIRYESPSTSTGGNCKNSPGNSKVQVVITSEPFEWRTNN